jgi:hypothetical protein
MTEFTEFARAVAEADRLVRTVPHRNAEPMPSDEDMKQIKDALRHALDLHSGAEKASKQLAKEHADATKATAEDDTAHLELSKPQKPASQPDVPGDIDHPGPPPASAPDLEHFGDDEPEPADAKPSGS